GLGCDGGEFAWAKLSDWSCRFGLTGSASFNILALPERGRFRPGPLQRPPRKGATAKGELLGSGAAGSTSDSDSECRGFESSLPSHIVLHGRRFTVSSSSRPRTLPSHGRNRGSNPLETTTPLHRPMILPTTLWNEEADRDLVSQTAELFVD